MNRPFGPEPRLYPFQGEGLPRETFSHFLREIRQCLENNKHADSYGALFGIGLSPKTAIQCCIIGSRTPEKFFYPKELIHEGFRVPVFLQEDYIWPAAVAPPHSWVKTVKHAEKIDLSGYSVGLSRDTVEAGSFGFYAGNRERNIYGFTAAHCTPTAKSGDEVVSPSSLELTGRLQVALPYTSFSSASRKVTQKVQKEVEVMLREFTPEECENGCEIYNHELLGKRIILDGKPFGTIVRKKVIHKSGIIHQHNARLIAENHPDFMLPGLEKESEEIKENIPSRIEWCCFNVLEDR